MKSSTITPLAVMPDFWHAYDSSIPSTAPELEQWQQVWIHSNLLGVVFGYWTGNMFRLYTKDEIGDVTHWGYVQCPEPPPIARQFKEAV